MTRLLTVFLVIACSRVHALSDLEIIRQTSTVEAISPEAAPLIARLESEIKKILSAGHLRPFRSQYGEDPLRVRYYNEPWQVMYTFARAYPYVSADLRVKMAAYVASEHEAYNVWSTSGLPDDTGAARQPDYEAVGKGAYKRRGTMLYALWLWCYVSNDFTLAKNNWAGGANLKNIYASIESSDKTYELISASIAMARLAAKAGTPEDVALYEQKAQTYMTQGRTFTAFRDNAFKDYTGKPQGNRGTENIAWPLFYLTPETARYMNSDDKLKNAVVDFVEAIPATQTDNGNAGKVGYVLWTFPLWYLAQPPNGDWGYQGESSSIGPETRMMLFNYFAWIKNESAAKMSYYLDVPDALIGDCFFIQNLVTAIEQHGKRDWR